MDYLKAFVVGGIICAIGQILVDKTRLTPARILVCYVVSGVILQFFGIYQYIVDFAGAGATVPLTGFGYNLCKGTIRAISDKGAIGILSGGFTASSSGLAAAVIFGLIASFIFKTKPKA